MFWTTNKHCNEPTISIALVSTLQIRNHKGLLILFQITFEANCQAPASLNDFQIPPGRTQVKTQLLHDSEHIYYSVEYIRLTLLAKFTKASIVYHTRVCAGSDNTMYSHRRRSGPKRINEQVFVASCLQKSININIFISLQYLTSRFFLYSLLFSKEN